MSGSIPEIVLFTYPGSPWGNKVVSYLNVRGIKYTECRQPPVMPRPDLEALGINYRRIPVLAIGRDVYFDTRLILEKLEQMIPGETLGATDAQGRAFEKLFRDWAELSLFSSAVLTMPPELPVFQNETFMKDRSGLTGRSFTAEDQAKRRPAALVEMRTHFELLEDLLSDGRKWLSGSENIRLVDIHAAFPIDWLLSMPNALPAEFFGSDLYPRTAEFMKRYQETDKAAARANSVKKSRGQEAAAAILSSGFADDAKGVNKDPLELVEGQTVRVFRTDDASSARHHFDTGKLLTLNLQEVVISRSAGPSNTEIRLHHPRWKSGVAAFREAQLS
ncbi:unnamed protein product [Clonostachys chloroleuca]|uniref:GST C-terminal domain-containing protein n=1 Tax=Clonostachys chloroleuca TaxID=1926264 RepID=A0AA35Q3R6_9HYPO|nr:unnamed protein product [Clonostachys chloroleuca]